MREVGGVLKAQGFIQEPKCFDSKEHMPHVWPIPMHDNPGEKEIDRLEYGPRIIQSVI